MTSSLGLDFLSRIRWPISIRSSSLMPGFIIVSGRDCASKKIGWEINASKNKYLSISACQMIIDINPINTEIHRWQSLNGLFNEQLIFFNKFQLSPVPDTICSQFLLNAEGFSPTTLL